MTLEAFPNELLRDVFGFLDAKNLIHAFNNLNVRFNMLLFNHLQSHSFDFRSMSKQDFNAFCQSYLPDLLDQVASLHLSNDSETPNAMQLFFSHGFTLDRFHSLTRLSLYCIDSFKVLNDILDQCRSLSHLTHIKLIKFGLQHKELESQLFSTIWSLSKLTHCDLDYMSSHAMLAVRSLSTISTTIKYLCMKNIYWSLSALYILLQHTPNLEHVHVFDVIGYDEEQLQATFPSIRSMNISFSGATSSLENLFRSFPNLNRLTLRTSGVLLNGHQWESLMVQYLPQIKIFRFKMEFCFPSAENKQEQINDLIDSFCTYFWVVERQWFVQYDFNHVHGFNHDMIYTLPYAFQHMTYSSKNLWKSNCPDHKQLQSFNRVQTLFYLNKDASVPTVNSPYFTNVHMLRVVYPLNNYFGTVVSLQTLTAVEIMFNKDHDDYSLQGLLEQMPCLYSLTIELRLCLLPMLLQLKNRSIRRLNFMELNTYSSSFYFNSAQCTNLYRSKLGLQCEVLALQVERRNDILELIKAMKNLRCLSVRCKDDQWSLWSTSSNNDELRIWLSENLPACSIIRHSAAMSYVQIWIDF